MTAADLVFRLPEWFRGFLANDARARGSPEERMRLVLSLAGQNVREGTGGPFAAAVFETRSGKLVAAGVNLVTFENCSVLHAEMVALMLAQKAAGTYDLGAPGLPPAELVCTAEPCAMCLGAIPWSGVSGLLCAARGEDVEAVGFDEGSKPADWPGELRSRGVEVVRDLLRAEAVVILRDYAARGGVIYNGRARSALS